VHITNSHYIQSNLSSLNFSLKQVFVTKHRNSNAGSEILKNFKPRYNCFVYEILTQSQAKFIKKSFHFRVVA